MRRVYLHRPGHPMADDMGMVEVRYIDPEEAELAIAGPKHVAIVGDSHYSGIRSPIDGTPIDSRTKRRQYMKDHGLADYDDYKGVWAKAEKRREDVQTGHFDEKERKEAVEKAWWQVTEKNYKPQKERAEVLALDGVKAQVDLKMPDKKVKLAENE